MRMTIIRVSACWICHPELDEIEGRTPRILFPSTEIYAKSGQIGAAALRTEQEISGDDPESRKVSSLESLSEAELC